MSETHLADPLLLEYWVKACNQFCLSDDAGFALDLLIRYREGHRSYHNLDHLLSALEQVTILADQMGLSDDEYYAAVLAAFYHDAVYIPGFAYNEKLSADMAEAHLSLMGLGGGWIRLIRYAIESTKNHQSTSNIGRVLIDADLHELGTTRYYPNGFKVRKEFGDITNEQWIEGRKKFLTTFLDRPRIFLIDGQEGLEKNARRNMQTELQDIGGCPRDTDGDGDCGQRHCPYCNLVAPYAVNSDASIAGQVHDSYSPRGQLGEPAR